MQETHQNQELSSEKLYLLGGVIMFGILGFGYYFGKRQSRNPSLKNGNSSQQTYSDLVRLCKEQEETQLEDCNTIEDALVKFNQEIEGLNHQLSSQYNTTFFESQVEKTLNRMESSEYYRRSEMRKTLVELLKTYPEIPDDISFENLKNYYEKCQHHHERVLNLACAFLPEIYALMKRAEEVLADSAQHHFSRVG